MRRELHEADCLQRAVAAVTAVQRFPRRSGILHCFLFIGRFESSLAVLGAVMFEVAHLKLVNLVVFAGDFLLEDKGFLLHSFDLIIESALVVSLELELRHQLLDQDLQLSLHL